MDKRHGFTLTEMMIVVLVLGILATIAFPRYIMTVEKGRSTEARQALGAIREAEIAYYLEFDAFTASINALGLPYPGACNAGYYFNYGIAINGAAFTATATRCTGGAGKPPSAAGSYVLNLTQAGVLGGTTGIV